MISATVRGSRRDPYRQTIRITTTSTGHRSLLGSCTCPVGYNCKHVAAVLLACVSARRHSPEGQTGSRQALIPSGPRGGNRTPAMAPAAPPVEEPLPPEVEAWLRGLEAAQEDETDDYPPTVRKRLLYVLERGAHAGVTVSLASIELKRDGSISSSVQRNELYQLVGSSQQARFVRPVDRLILAGLARLSSRDGGAELPDLLRRIAATGRGRWGSWDGPVVTEGAPVPGRLTWSLSEDGRQRPVLEVPEPLLALNLAEPWYADAGSGAIGPVQTELPHRLREKLQPRLVLLAGDLPLDSWAFARSRRGTMPPMEAYQSVPLARLSFQYGPVTLTTPVSRDTVVRNGRLLTVIRDPAGEARAWERLH